MFESEMNEMNEMNEITDMDNFFLDCTPPEIREEAEQIVKNRLLPNTSKKRYELAYKNYKSYTKDHGINNTSESVLLAYFGELSRTKAPSSLWTQYSMLKSTISLNENIAINKFAKLLAFLKTFGKGHKPKKSSVFTGPQINSFLDSAPDDTLAMKVVAIMGVCGACRISEMINMKTQDVTLLSDNIIMVKVPETKTGHPRSFVIQDTKMVSIVLKYWNLRPMGAPTERFFLNYKAGKCTKQVIGKNQLGAIPKKIASFLNLPTPEGYTGHSFRRTSATLLADSGADLLVLKRHGGWKSDSVAEGYVAESTHNKKKTATLITATVTESPTATSSEKPNIININFSNNYNVNLTLNFNE